MKRIATISATLRAAFTLAACGNNATNNSSRDQASTRSSVSNRSASQSIKNSSSTNQSSATTNSATKVAGRGNNQPTSANKAMTTSQVMTRVAQLKNVNLNGGDKIYVTPTGTPNVFKIYIKGANQDPQVDSIADHYIYNGDTDVISQATER